MTLRIATALGAVARRGPNKEWEWQRDPKTNPGLRRLGASERQSHR